MKDLGYITGHVGKWHLELNRETKKWFAEHGYKSLTDVPAAVANSYRPQAFGYDEYAQGAGNSYWSNFDVNGKTFSPRAINYRQYEGRAHADKFRIQLQTELALAFLNRHVDKPRPFFLYLAYYGPHSPMNAPASLTDQVLSLDELEARGYDNTTARYEQNVNYPRDYTQAEVRQQGLALLKGIDNGVGDIYTLLEERGEWRTLSFSS